VVKINWAHYRHVVLRQTLLTDDIRSSSGSEFIIFLQDMPNHIASKTQYSAAGSRDVRFYPTRSLAE